MNSFESLAVDRARATPMLEQVLAWTAVNSGSSNLSGLERMRKMLAEAFSVLPAVACGIDGGPVEEVLPDGSRRSRPSAPHLHLSVRPNAPVQLVLTGHFDTVFGADHPFQKAVWLEAGKRLNAPGATDMKGGIAIMLAALASFEQHPDAQMIGYDVVLNSDEETGSASSAALLHRLATGKRAGLTFEPSVTPDGALAADRPGTGNFDIVVTGRAAHAGRNPHEGRNAVLAAADIALRLATLRCDDLLVNPAKIDGGGPNNIVPDKAILRINLRPRSLDAVTGALAAIKGITEHVAQQHQLTVEVCGHFNRPPKPMGPSAQWLYEAVRNCGRDLGLQVDWVPSGGVCDGNNIAAAGVPVVDTLGARGGAIHSASEYLIVDSLPERAALTTLLLCRLATGAI